MRKNIVRIITALLLTMQIFVLPVQAETVIQTETARITVLKKWKQTKDGWKYQREDGSYAKNTFEVIGGKTYYFDKNGYMVTGWRKVSGKWYYFAGSGAMKTGWLKSGGYWYYLKSSGEMVTGWQKISGKWYYFTGSGSMKTGWLKSGGYWYYLKGSGEMATGWLKLSGRWYYLYSSGKMATGVQSVSGKTYRFNTGGTLADHDYALKIAQKYVGRGGACSEICYFYTYELLGIHGVPSYVRQWPECGRQVSYDELLPGDIVSYVDKSSGYELHVGVYLGNNQVLHGNWLGSARIVDDGIYDVDHYRYGYAYVEFYRVEKEPPYLYY